jgi:hypothetical protein
MSFKLFIGSIPTKTCPEHLLTFLKGVNNYQFTITAKHKGDTINAGFAIVECDCKSSYDYLLGAKLIYKDRELDIKEFREGSQLESHKKLCYQKRIYISDLNKEITGNDLK